MSTFLAHLRLHFYLLTQGMWRGESEFSVTDHHGNLIFLAATTGSVWDDSIRAQRVFFDPKNIAHNIQ